MTVTANTTRNDYVAGANQNVYQYTFQLNLSSNVTVMLNGVVQTLNVHYTVQDLNNGSGGTITFTLVDASNNPIYPTQGFPIAIFMSMELDRDADYQPNGAFLATEVNSDYDRLWLVANQQQTAINRSLRLQDSDPSATSPTMQLPSKDSRLGKYLGFDVTTGEPVAVGSHVGVADTLEATLVSGNVTNGNDIIFSDNDKATFGASFDLQIYHDSSASGASVIKENGNGNLKIYGSNIEIRSSSDELYFEANQDGVVKLYCNNEQRLTTTDSGINVTGLVEFDSLSGTGAVAITDILDDDTFASASSTTISTSESIKAYVDNQSESLADILANGNSTTGNDISVSAGDDITFTNTSKALFGASSALEIYSDGTASYITENTGGGTGNLIIRGSNLEMRATNDEMYLDATENGVLRLYCDNAIKLTTTSSGINVTGLVEFDSLSGVGSIAITDILDDDTFSTASATTLATSESIKAYVDSSVPATESLQNTLAAGNTTSGTDIAVSASDDITFTDSSKALFGASNDLEIYHDGTNSYITENSGGVGNLIIRGSTLEVRMSNDEPAISASENGVVQLYCDGVEKFRTISAGAYVYGSLTVSGTVDGRDVSADGTKLDGVEAGADITDTANVTSAGALMDSELTDIASVKALNQGVATTDSPTFAGLTTTSDIAFGDNNKALFGASSDLQVYHDGLASYISEVGNGNLKIMGSNLEMKSTSDEMYLDATENGVLRLYCDNDIKLTTTSSGVTVAGTVKADGLELGDNETATFGVGNDLQIYHDGSHSRILDNGTGNLIIQGTNLHLADSTTGEFFLQAISNGAVQLYHNGSAKLATTSTGIDVTGGLVANGAGISSSTYGLKVFNSTPTEQMSVRDDGLITMAGSSIVHITKGLGLYVDGNVNVRGFIWNDGGDVELYGDTKITSGDFTVPSGNVGIGDSNPANGYLTVRGASTTGTINGHVMLTGDSATNGQGPQIVFSESGGSSNYAGASVGYVRTGSNGIGDLVFGTRATSGDATTITTERMRIDSSGRVGIGCSPESRLSVLQSALDGNALVLPMASDATSGNFVSIRGKYGVANEYCRGEVRFGVESFQVGSGFLAFATGTNTATEAMRIDSNGAVGIGTSGAATKVDIRDIGGRTIQLGKNPTTNYYGSSLYMSVDIGSTEKAFHVGTRYSATGGNLVFEHSTNDMGRSGDASALTYTERMRIDSSGNVLVGTDSQFSIGRVCSLAADGVASFETKPNADISYNAAMFLNSANSQVGRILCTSSATSYVTSSDPRLKSEFTKTSGALGKIVEARDNDYIGSFYFLDDPETTVWGYNAHALLDNQAGFGGTEGTGPRELSIGEVYDTELVSEATEAIPSVEEELAEDGTVLVEAVDAIPATEAVYKDLTVSPAGVDQSKRVPLLEAAIYELLQLNQDLTARIEALEA